MLSAYLLVAVGAPVVGFIPAVYGGAFSSNFRKLPHPTSLGLTTPLRWMWGFAWTPALAVTGVLDEVRV